MFPGIGLTIDAGKSLIIIFDFGVNCPFNTFAGMAVKLALNFIRSVLKKVLKHVLNVTWRTLEVHCT